MNRVTTPAISFVIPVRDNAPALRRCLTSIERASAGIPYEVIVGDNGSRDETAAVAASGGAKVQSVPGRPVADVRNTVAAAVTTPLIAFVDADHEIVAGWTAIAVRAFDDPAVSAAGAEYHAPSGGTWVQRVYNRFRAHPRGVHPVLWLPSGNLVVRRSVFEAVRGFDAGLESCEDVDFCRKVRQAGGRLISVEGLTSVHFGDPPSLSALFFGELWRGRDNLRVSLRERLTLRSAPGVLMPVLMLAAFVALVVGAITRGVWLSFGAATTMVVMMFARAVLLWMRTPEDERTASEAGRTFSVAATYEVARALALVVRASHVVRHRS